MLNFIALFTALSISGVAAYYSIYGLTAIFSGVFWPIVIMGSVLEVGKIVTTVWLHTYWHQLRWLLKSYMSIAVAVLMFITSMGIFGFLSKAHIEVTSQAGGGQLLVQQVDQNIAIEQRRIDDARKVMAQMDDAVAGLLKGSGANAERDNNRTATMTAQATKLRDGQKKERDSLNSAIDNANNRIGELNKQKLKLEQEQLKMEAEVGPIKYIAQLIYDDSASKDMMERAVRWVIIVIVAVFDPLAVAMVLGVTMVMNKRKEEQAELQAQAEAIVYQEPTIIEKIVEVPVEVEKIVEIIKEVPIDRIVTQAVPIMQDNPELIAEKEELEIKLAEAIAALEELQAIEPVEKVIEVEKIVEVQVHDHERMAELAGEIDNLLEELKRKDKTIQQLRAEVELEREELAGIDASEFAANASTSAFGQEYPANPVLGQLFYNTKTLALSKWNGNNWIDVDKNQNTSYMDEHFLHMMIGKISRGEVDFDINLTEAEKTALEPFITGNNGK